MLMVLVATPIRQMALAAAGANGILKLKFDADCVVMGALKRLDTELDGKSAVVPVPQLEPVPYCRE